jgi:hypothetical protein
LRWPIAVDEYLDELVAAAHSAGERTNRKELLAALVATHHSTGAELGMLLRRYRTMAVRDVVPGAVEADDVIELTRRRPGPRQRETQ